MIRCLVTLVVITIGVAGPSFAQQAWPPPRGDFRPAPEVPGERQQPEQVTVSAKIIEFQAIKGVETGLSAYFRRRARTNFFGVIQGLNGLMTADLTFPTATAAGITVLLDRIRLSEGDIEVLLQALVDENRASILARPRMTVVLKGAPNTIQIARDVPYENTTVVGNTTVQTTAFHTSGVTLTVSALELFDGDGNWATTDDTFIKLHVTGDVSEEGARIIIALDDLLAGGGFAEGQNAIEAPEFISRRVDTEVWLRHGQILVLGGLYSSEKSKSLATLPWLSQAEDVAVGVAERAVPGEFLASPVSSTLGNRRTTDSRRELVFLLKAEVWRPAYTVPAAPGLIEPGLEEEKRVRPADLITDVLGEMKKIPEEISQDIKGQTTESGVESDLGASE